MPSKAKATAIRFPEELSAQIGQLATVEKISAHKAVLNLVREALAARGLGGAGLLPALDQPTIGPGLQQAVEKAQAGRAALAQAEEKAAHLAKAAPKRRRSAWNLKGVQVGPMKPAFGALSKAGKGKK